MRPSPRCFTGCSNDQGRDCVGECTACGSSIRSGCPRACANGGFRAARASAAAEQRLPGTADARQCPTGRRLSRLKDQYGEAHEFAGTARRLPPFDFDFVQSHGALILIRRGAIAGAHPLWEFILEPGKVGDEKGDVARSEPGAARMKTKRLPTWVGSPFVSIDSFSDQLCGRSPLSLSRSRLSSRMSRRSCLTSL